MKPQAVGIASNRASNADDVSSNALADALSSSLASIVAGGTHRVIATRAPVGERASAEDGSNNSSDGGGAHSSSSSSGREAGIESASGEAAVVTATNTGSSGGDDRDSSTGNASREAFKDSSSDSNTAAKHKHARMSDHRRHVQHRQRKDLFLEIRQGSADEYGLPVPVDDRLHRQNHSEHATVVAHLPPPKPDTTNSSGSGGETDRVTGEDRYEPGSLLQPHREPGFHTIRRTFNRLVRRAANTKSSETDSSGDNNLAHHKYKAGSKRMMIKHADKKESKKRKLLAAAPSDRGSDNDESGGNGSSSGSGTEGGYAGSASSNENAAQVGSCSSPSVSSSEDSVGKHKRGKSKAASSTKDPSRPLLSHKQDSTLSMSSEIADFSSGSSEGGEDQGFAAAFSQSPSSSPSITSSSDEQEDGFIGEKLAHKVQKSSPTARKRHASGWPPLPLQVSGTQTSSALAKAGKTRLDKKPRGNLKSEFPTLDGKPPILSVGCDIMAHILTFLEPPDILDVLTMPLSKDWLSGFTRQPELWRVLCLLDPFKAQVEHGDSSSDSSDESVDSYSANVESELRRAFGKFRFLYTSFVRCLRYLSRIKEDALNGRPPSIIDYGTGQLAGRNIRANTHLHQFLARARGVVVRNRQAAALENSDISDDDNIPRPAEAAVVEAAIGVSDDGSSTNVPRKCTKKPEKTCKRKKRVKYGHSILTQRLLGPAADGTPGNNELPWSCAIYSIVNWMVAFFDVEGIQTMCLKVLPFLLEDEQQRMTAQRAGLTDIVLRSMVMFPDSTSLHTAAFHTIVLLARPLGGREGMLFHSSMVNSSGIFSAESGSSDGRNGIAVMLDSMRRFQHNEVLQAMSCWSLVNIALAPSQKEMLVKLGGIEVTANAMTTHPYSAEVQFRALFALINLVIPSVSVNENPEGGAPEAVVQVEDSSEKELLDEMVDHLVNLVVLAMKNFCASEAILNRACLVLHNLSLTQEFHEALLLTPNCYQMLEWCLANYPADQVLQQSAAGTLHRLQITLSSDETLRNRFTTTLQLTQRESLEQAHQEAILLHEQYEEQRRAQGLDFDASGSAR